MTTPPVFPDRTRFLRLALLFEGGLAALALLLGWISGVDPLATLRFSWWSIGWGLIATVPLFTLFLLFFYHPAGPLLPIKRSLMEVLAPLLDRCHPLDLVGLAALAGLTEELLFRGFLQVWIESKTGPVAALIGSNLLFGLAHMITPLYALLAGIIGAYLGLVFDAGEQRNLLTPVIVHGLYDYLAFLVVVRSYRSNRTSTL